MSTPRLIIAALCLSAVAWADGALPNAAASIEAAKFAGTWYEIARFPSFFQKGCVATTATYTLTPEGEYTVKNQCRQDTLTGAVKGITGKAWVPDARQPGKLRLQMVWPFSADLWVIEVAPDYRYAVLGNPDLSKAWVFSRTPQLDEALYADIVARLKARGYQVSQLEKVLQPPN